MPQNQRMLEGEVIDPNGDDREIDRLRDDLRRVTAERDALRQQNIQLQRRVNQVDVPAHQMREKLEPFYRLLQALWGDIEVIDPQPAVQTQSPNQQSSTPPVNDKAAAAWDEWKTRMAGAAAKIITALQTHADADVAQLCILIGTSRKQTVYDAICKLNKAGLINNNGDRFSLKQL
jgi:small-conductance mechanosensitive channel